MNFYCKRVCGDPDFSIKEWNQKYQTCLKLGLSQEETRKILHPDLYPCKTQCEDCMNIVLDTQSKNRKIKLKSE